MIRDTNPEKEIERIIAYHLQNEQELLKAYTEVKDSLKEVLVEKSDLFSILNVPPPRKEKTSSKVFAISDVCDIAPGMKERSMEFEELQVRCLIVHKVGDESSVYFCAGNNKNQQRKFIIKS